QSPQSCAALQLLVGRSPAQLITQRLRRVHDKGLELADCLSPRGDRTLPGSSQDPQCLTIAPGPRRGQVLAAESFAGGSDRIQALGLGPVAAGWPGRAVDLDDPLAAFQQRGGQPGPVAAGSLDRPHATAGRVLAGECRQPTETECVCYHREL